LFRGLRPGRTTDGPVRQRQERRWGERPAVRVAVAVAVVARLSFMRMNGSTGSGTRLMLTRGVLFAAGVLTLLCVALFGAALRSDGAITAHRAQDTAEVLAVNVDRTLVRYTTPDGRIHVPANGVLYPDDLRVGQLVRVEYDSTNPALVRVAGRSAAGMIVPLLAVIGCSWVIAGAVAWWRRQRERATAFLPGGT